MISYCSFSGTSILSAKSLQSTSPLCFFRSSPRNPSRVWRTIRNFSESAVSSDSNVPSEVASGRRSNYAGVRLDETVDMNSGKLRLDSWISSRITGISRARVQSSIRTGLVSVNGRVIDKVSHTVRDGDQVNCMIAELQPLKAEAEDIPLDIVYEDEHVLVVNKPAHMVYEVRVLGRSGFSGFFLDAFLQVVHPAPGNANGTLVNGILHHCSLSSFEYPNHEVVSETEDFSDDDLAGPSTSQSVNGDINSGTSPASIRPGIVHRLDKGTSGLLVVAKDEHSHAHLSEQFKQRTIHRVYVSLTCGVPSPTSGRIDIPIGRDLNNRIRMIADVGQNKSGQARNAASRYKVIEILAGGGSALVEWRLETGRTHQIRAHAKYLGIPLLGDEVYGGTKSMAMSVLRPKTPSILHGQLSLLVSGVERPCLHALALGFTHPHTGKKINFSCLPPPDFAEILTRLREIGRVKV